MPDAYEFGAFRLDAAEHRLLRDGLPVPLSPKAFDLLVDLVQHAGRLREKARLMEALWPDTFVEEVNLAYTVSAVRRALGDDRSHPQFIETVATKGYRFVAPVTAHGEPSERETPTAAPAPPAPLDEDTHQPYPGLRSFTEDDAAVFFGREDEVRALWTRIRAHRLLAVIGPSGAGKTSFLRAGVIPECPDGWTALVCTPGTAPLRALGQALAPALANDVEALRRLVSFDDPDVAFDVLARWRQAHPQALVVIDQFEELFTNNPPDVQARVAALVGRLAGEADVHLVLSMRDDFFMRCHEHEALAGVFGEVTPLGVLPLASLRRALAEPARRFGYRFEDESLVDDMIGSVEGARAALPMLAFAVARLWDLRDRDRKMLTRATYERIGGVGGALAQHAEATLDRIGAAHQDLVRDMFRNLVTAQGTRAVIDRDDLLSAFPGRPEAGAVLRSLVDARLLTTYEVRGEGVGQSRHRVEIVHESLLTAWPRLLRWRTQDEDAAQLRDQLKQAAHLWEEKGRTPDLLWTGAACREYALWRERYTGALTATEDAFARAMVARARRRRRIQRAALAAVIVSLSLVAIAVWVSRQRAADAARRAEASQLLTQAEFRFAGDPTEAALLAGASLELFDTRAAREFLMKVLWSGPLAFEIVADQSVRNPAFTTGGKLLATAGHLDLVRVWTEDGGGPIVLPAKDPSPRGPYLAWWASEDLLVTGPSAGGAKRVDVWSLPDAKHLRTIEFGASTNWQVAPGRLLAETDSGTGRGADLRSWTLPAGEPVSLGHEDEVPYRSSLTFFEPNGHSLLYVKGADVLARALPVGTTADRVFDRLPTALSKLSVESRRLVFGNDLGEYHVWDYAVADKAAMHAARMPPPADVANEPDRTGSQSFPDSSGRWIVQNVDRAPEIRLWDRSAWADADALKLRRSASWYGAGWEVHPSGDWVVASTARFTRLTFWPVRRAHARIVEGYQGFVRPLAFSADGKWLATGWSDGTLRLWPLPGSSTSAVRTLDLPENLLLTGLAFEPASRYLCAVGGSGRVWLVPLDGSQPRTLSGLSEDTLVYAVAVSPSGRRIAAAFGYSQGAEAADRVLRVWDLDSGSTRRFDLPPGTASSGYERGIFSLAFIDESNLYSAGDGGLRRWNLDTGTPERVVAAPPGLTVAAWFSRDTDIALTTEFALGRDLVERRPVRIYDTRAGTFATFPHALDDPGQMRFIGALDPSGRVAAVGSDDGVVRVWRVGDSEPHILAGHKGAIDRIAISPDLKWVATTGEDNTLRLWPMPDLSKPPLQTLPLDQLLAKLRSLTNLRAVRDPGSATGWKIEVGPFPGWKNTPTW